MTRCVAQRRHTVVWLCVCVCVCYRDSSSPGGIQVKLNASMCLKPHSLGSLWASRRNIYANYTLNNKGYKAHKEMGHVP